MPTVSPSHSPSPSDSTLPNGALASRPASTGSRLSTPPVTASMVHNANTLIASLPYVQVAHTPGPHTSSPLPYLGTFTNQGVPQQMTQNGFHRQPPFASIQAPPPQQAHNYHQAQYSPQPQHPVGPPSNHAPPPPPVRGDVMPPPNNGLTSPTSTHSVQTSPEYHNLVGMISTASPETVRQVIRDCWEKALLGSQYHVAFLLNATIHQANAETLNRAVKDFGSKMVKVSKQHVVRHLSGEDFDEIADLLLAKVSPNFLDKALARRFETIPARQLVNALARAERLGYDVQDIVEEEHVIPSLHSLIVPSIPSAPIPSQSVPSQSTPRSSSTGPVSAQAAPPALTVPGSSQRTQQGVAGKPALTSSKPNPGGVIYCTCGWPCSSTKAQEHHWKKKACNKIEEKDEVGKDLCPHCGCKFVSGNGLAYHQNVNVCGAYTEEQGSKMTSIIAAFRKEKRGQSTAATPASQTPSQSSPAWRQLQASSAQGTPKPGLTTPSSDPYSKLTPEQRRDFDKEMKEAEDHYGGLMRKAMELPKADQDKQIISLKNRYNTKQSVTRKKYGIRLRERRSKAQIDAERTRLFGTPDGPSLSGRDGAPPASKRARTGENGQSTVTTQSSGSQGGTPRKRIPVAEMGGLSGSSATAELNDPTASIQKPQEQQPNHIDGQAPSHVHPTRPGMLVASGTRDEPMSIDDNSSDSDSTDEDDIPASLPAAFT
ncbi:hypothetical protein G7Z17_g9401 [Cylindrodendrum hubeiense]|uniref:Uncharacterized protein n=1 Tax=Cylindrodendrum hubeiense TaxID=595255 RepID=A0A9P5H6U4_9HYPO|nr:hypothetical protein G7Z17_g9401 [Cylindrodendrum hubeiense]